MGETMNFSFQDSPVKQKMEEDVSFYSAPAPRFPTWPWKTPSDSLPVCNLDRFPGVQSSTVCPCGLTCCLCEPQPWASSCGCPDPTQGCWPTWNTIQVSSGLLTVHTPHFTTGQTILSLTIAPQNSLGFFLDGSKITKKTWTANL